MVKKIKKWPDVGELVLVTANKVIPQGVFVNLDEYENKEGFIHISEIASKWVKNIRHFVKEGQKVVTRVLRLNPKSNQIDLSLKRVSRAARRNKIYFSKRDQKTEKLMEYAAKKLNKSLDQAYEEVGFKLQEHFDDMYHAFEKSLDEGSKPFEKANISQDWIKTLVPICQSSIEKPKVSIKENVELKCYENDGLLKIKEIFKNTQNEIKDNGSSVKMYFVGAPRYRIEVTSSDYKSAEKILSAINDSLSNQMKNFKGSISFDRLKK